MKNFKDNIRSRNQSFQREFKKGMDDFSKAFNDLFKDNKIKTAALLY